MVVAQCALVPFAVAAAFIGLLLVACEAPQAVAQSTNKPSSADALAVDPLAAAEALERRMIDVIAAREKSVVAIAQDRRRRGQEDRASPLDIDPAGLRRISPQSPDFVPTYFGAGIVIDRAGFVLTNYHVLGFDSEDYTVDHYVTTRDRKVYQARIKGADARIDLAVLELVAPEAPGRPAKIDLEPMPLGNGDAVRKGSFVLTLGNPYALGRDGQASAGWGVVANVARKAGADIADEASPGGKATLHHYGTLIETDARLNLGASGGALLNLRGEMIGLTTAAAAQVGYEKSAGYAIPVNDLFRRAVDALREGREIEYGFLGIQPSQPTTEERLANRGGVRVDRVVLGGPAERSGVRRDDIILSVNEQPVFDADSLVLAVGQLAPGVTVKMAMLRNGVRQLISAETTKLRVGGRQIVTRRPADFRGLTVDYPSALVGPQLFTEIPADCVIVVAVSPGSIAEKAGLAAGKLIVKVAGRPVRTPAMFREAIAGQSGPVELVVRQPDGQERKVTLVQP